MYEDIKTACLYVRYSSNNQTEQSIEGQTRVCQEFCKRHNIKIVEVYADRATSASKDIEKRVNFLKMIKDSEKDLFDAVVVYKLDRFSRSRYDMANYKYRLKKNGVQLISATENITTDPEGIILESVLEGMPEFYSAELSQKINRGLRESAYKHNSIGGSIPLGYKTVDKKLVIDEETAPIVREAFRMYAEGHTVAEICRTFNAKGYKTSKGTRFGKSSFSKIFRNERYIGVYQFHEYRAEDVIPPIIDRKLFDQVQARLSAQKPSGTYTAKRVFLLSGKLFCGHCGSRMNGNSNGSGGYSYYECYGKKNKHKECTKRNLRKEFIEMVVARDAMALLTDENIDLIADTAVRQNVYEIEATSNIPSIKDRLHETQLSLDNLAKAIEGGQAPETLVKRMVELEKDKKTLETELHKEEKGVVYLQKPQVIYWLEQFKGGNIEDEEFRRMVIDLFVNSVTVWDEPDDYFKITIAYNLTSLPTKTYRLQKGGTLSDSERTAPVGISDEDRIVAVQRLGIPHELRPGAVVQLLLRLVDADHVITAVLPYGLDLKQVAAYRFLHEFRHALRIALCQIHYASVPVILSLAGIVYDQICHDVCFLSCSAFLGASSSLLCPYFIKKQARYQFRFSRLLISKSYLKCSFSRSVNSHCSEVSLLSGQKANIFRERGSPPLRSGTSTVPPSAGISPSQG